MILVHQRPDRGKEQRALTFFSVTLTKACTRVLLPLKKIITLSNYSPFQLLIVYRSVMFVRRCGGSRVHILRYAHNKSYTRNVETTSVPSWRPGS